MSASVLRGLVVVAVVVAFTAACGDDDGTDAGDLPVDTGEVGDDIPTDPACLPDEPDCDDQVVVPDEGRDPDSVGDSSGMTVDEALSVGEALVTDASGVLAVKGYGFVDEDGARLCESLAPGGERYECGGADLATEGLDLDATGAEIVFHDGLTYTDGEITVFGEIVDGVLVVDDRVIG